MCWRCRYRTVLIVVLVLVTGMAVPANRDAGFGEKEVSRAVICARPPLGYGYTGLAFGFTVIWYGASGGYPWGRSEPLVFRHTRVPLRQVRCLGQVTRVQDPNALICAGLRSAGLAAEPQAVRLPLDPF
jgi:hypothetical protein